MSKPKCGCHGHPKPAVKKCLDQNADDVELVTRNGRRVPAKCLLWQVRDKCCQRLNPVPESLPLVPAFCTLLHDLAPAVPDEQLSNRTFRDGDALPAAVCGSSAADSNNTCSAPAEWKSMTAPGQPGVSVWAERHGQQQVLRCRLPPGMAACKVDAMLVCPSTGLTRAVALTLETPFEYRSLDGSGNNRAHPLWGAANTLLRRVAAADYGDGKSSLRAGANPRDVSNKVARFNNGQSEPPLSASLSDMVWAWGQFIDHEFTLTPDDSGESANVEAPGDDPTLPNGVIQFHRSRFVNDADGVRQQPNVLSAYMDASNVYGADERRALGLRALDGTGRLKTSHAGALPPYNVGAVYENANANRSVSLQDQFLCGDVRANENALLLAVHTLFVLEHNRLCDALAQQHPEWRGDDERLYQEARRIVIALTQKITYDEFLPALLGTQQHALPPYAGYDAATDASIANEFSAALFRFGHTMVSNELWLDAHGARRVPLADLFFEPAFVAQHGVAPLFEGAAAHRMQRVDSFIVEALRNMLFGQPGQPARALHDLATLNIQRGRDHGLPPYNAVRRAYGLSAKTSFADVSSSASVQAALAAAYNSVDDVDVWVGALSEDHLDGGAQVGELLATALREQFGRLRDGDRFFYERDLPLEQLNAVRQTTLADVIRRNTNAALSSDNVFVVA